jgi:hypothetical protein
MFLAAAIVYSTFAVTKTKMATMALHIALHTAVAARGALLA